MKSQLVHVDHHDVRYDALQFVCPGCMEMPGGGSGLHMLPVTDTQGRRPSWSWDGNLEAPTLSPSILTHGRDDNRCHSFLRAGVFEFLTDSTHSLAGQHIPMPDLFDWVAGT